MEKSLPTLLTPGRFPLSDNEGAQSVIRVAQTINSETISKSLVFFTGEISPETIFLNHNYLENGFLFH
jgi:hypothetical protein